MSLVLTRQRDERVVCRCRCGCVIEVGVAGIKGDRARLAFDASRDVSINRKEIDDAKQSGATDKRSK